MAPRTSSQLSYKFDWPKDKRSQRVFSYIIKLATDLMDVKKIILYGSRARGDSNRLSDYDFALELDNDKGNWGRFFVEVQDNLETLLNIDLVRLDKAGQDLKKNILRDGKVIYERP